MRHFGLISIVALAAIVGGVPLAAQGSPESHWVRCGDSTYRYMLHVPPHNGPAPALVLLHGAGDVPEAMIEVWRDLADHDGIVLVAPALPRVAAFEGVAPAVFRCVVDQAARLTQIDPRRVYLFGHSMGGYLAYDAALLESRYFAAAAIHGMALDPAYAWIIGKAVRKTPIVIFAGERDPYATPAAVQWTRDTLQANGFPVRLVELPGRGHNDYGPFAASINADAWKFLSAQTLSGP